MKRRELQMGVLVLLICGLPFVGIELKRRLTLYREETGPAAPHKFMLRRKFLSIKPKDGQVLMVPQSSPNRLGVPNANFYTMSLPKNDYWTKPMVVGVGFKFGYSSGAKSYQYKILDIHERGVRISYWASMETPGAMDLLWQ